LFWKDRSKMMQKKKPHKIHPVSVGVLHKNASEDLLEDLEAVTPDGETKKLNPSKSALEFRMDLKGELKKFLPYTQKAVVLKLLALERDGDGVLDADEVNEAADTVVQNIKDGMINSYANLGVLSALVGITTYASVLSPLDPSSIDIPIHGFTTYGIRACSVLNMCSTCCALVTICLATSYIYIVSNLLITRHDLVWFMVNVESVFHCLIGTVLCVLLALASLLTSCFALYSLPTANICVIVGAAILGLFFILLGPVLKQVLGKIDERTRRYMSDHEG
jgi:hypothetical protein